MTGASVVAKETGTTTERSHESHAEAVSECPRRQPIKTSQI